MWYQKDWFTGIDYYNLKEKQIHVAEQRITKPVEQQFHEQTEIYYVKSGDADIWINGEKFHVQAGSFFLSVHAFVLSHRDHSETAALCQGFLPYWIVYVFVF